MIKKISKKSKPVHIVKGEIRIMIIIAYITIVAVIGLAVFDRERGSYQEDIRQYILCESSGTSPDCLLGNSIGSDLSITAFVMLGLLPVMVLIVNCNLKFRSKTGG